MFEWSVNESGSSQAQAPPGLAASHQRPPQVGRATPLTGKVCSCVIGTVSVAAAPNSGSAGPDSGSAAPAVPESVPVNRQVVTRTEAAEVPLRKTLTCLLQEGAVVLVDNEFHFGRHETPGRKGTVKP